MNYIYIATSLNGFIATKGGEIEWLHNYPNPNHDDYGYSEFINHIDAIVMGRHSFEKILSFNEWPYKEKVFVLTSTLTKVPSELTDQIELITGNPQEILSYIHSQGLYHLLH